MKKNEKDSILENNPTLVLEGEAAHEEVMAKAYKKQNKFNFFGFAIFDIIHLIVAALELIHLFRHEPESSLRIAECFVEIVLSFVLVGYVHALAESRDSEQSAAKYFNYAWLLASSSLLIPTLFNIPGFIGAPLDARKVLGIALVAMEITMFLNFFIALSSPKHITLWKLSHYIGMGLFALSGFLEIADYFLIARLYDGMNIFYATAATLKNIAPLILAVFGYVGLLTVDISDNGRIL